MYTFHSYSIVQAHLGNDLEEFIDDERGMSGT